MADPAIARGGGDMPSPEHWSLDKKVPIALMIAIVMQTVGVVWWASKLESRVEAVEIKAAATAVRLDQADKVDTDVAKQLARIEEWQRGFASGADRIERKLDKLADRFDTAPPPPSRGPR